MVPSVRDIFPTPISTPSQPAAGPVPVAPMTYSFSNPIITRRSYPTSNGEDAYEIDATFPLNMDMSGVGNILSRLFEIVGVSNDAPVERGLSHAELSSGVEEIMYNPSLSIHHCPISWEEFEEGQFVYRIRHCGHIFNKDNLNNWFRRHTACPLCRYDLAINNQPEMESDSGVETDDYSDDDAADDDTANSFVRDVPDV